VKSTRLVFSAKPHDGNVSTHVPGVVSLSKLVKVRGVGQDPQVARVDQSHQIGGWYLVIVWFPPLVRNFVPATFDGFCQVNRWLGVDTAKVDAQLGLGLQSQHQACQLRAFHGGVGPNDLVEKICSLCLFFKL
jgi:hypothetical protein